MINRPLLTTATTKEDQKKVLEQEAQYVKAMNENWKPGDPVDYLYEEKRAPLSDQDVSKIKRQQRNLLIIYPVLQIGVTYFCVQLILQNIDPHAYSLWFALLFLLTGIYFYFNLASTSKKGKEIVTGIITKRDFNTSTKTHLPDHWFFEISEKRTVETTEKDYWTYRLGDTISVEVIPGTFTVNNKIEIIDRQLRS